MKKTTRVTGLLMVMITILTTLTICLSGINAGATTAKTVKANIKGKVLYSYEYKVLDLINKERAKKGLTKFKMDKALVDVATTRAAECAVYYSHQRPNGDKNGFKMYKWKYAVGENIAINQTTPAQVVKAWMNSPKHKSNILNKKFKSMGVGCFLTNGNYYWVQFFVDNRVNNYKKPADATKKYTITISKDILNTFQYENTLTFETAENKNISLYQNTMTLNGFNFTTLIENESVTYKSNDENIVTVDNQGNVVPKQNGETTVTAYLKGAEEKALTWTVTVDMEEDMNLISRKKR